MSFNDELHLAFSHFSASVHQDGHEDILSMPYAEYSLQCFALYKDMLYKDILCADGALAQAFCLLGIIQPRDQLMFFIDTFYLFRQMQNQQIN